MADPSLNLAAFVEAAGADLADAQGSIAGANLATTAMAVSEAVLEARVALATRTDGSVAVETVDRKTMQSLGDGARHLSTLTVNFVALTAPSEQTTATSAPKMSRDDVVGTVAARSDVQRLACILGPLNFDAVHVPEAFGWWVSVTDELGRPVRQIMVKED